MTPHIMHKNLLAVSAIAIAASFSMAHAQMSNNDTAEEAAVYGERRDAFQLIDADDNQVITKGEFIDYAQQEQDMTRSEAEDLFDEITDTDAELTMVTYQSSEKLNAWDERQDGDQARTAAKSEPVNIASNQTSDDQYADEEETRNVETSGRNDQTPRADQTANRNVRSSSQDVAAVSTDASQTDANTQQSNSQSRDAQDRTASTDQADESDEQTVVNQNFAVIDDNGDSFVTQSEFTQFIANADNVTKAEAKKLFKAAAGEDKKMTLAEFVDSGDELESVAEDIAGEPSAKLQEASVRADRQKSVSAGDVSPRENSAESGNEVRMAQSQQAGSNNPPSQERESKSSEAQYASSRRATLDERQNQKTENASNDSQSVQTQQEQSATTAVAQGYGDEADDVKITASVFEEMDSNDNDSVTKSEFMKYNRKQARQMFEKISGDDSAITLSELRASEKYGQMRKAELD